MLLGAIAAGQTSAESQVPAAARQLEPALPALCLQAPAAEHESTVQGLPSSQLTVVAQLVPQLVTELRARSQPLVAFASQSSVLAAHAVQDPELLHVLFGVEHALPGQPQFASVFAFSQLSAALPLQSKVAEPHATHEPAEHV